MPKINQRTIKPVGGYFCEVCMKELIHKMKDLEDTGLQSNSGSSRVLAINGYNYHSHRNTSHTKIVS